jgi:hypothetical protein
MSLIHSEQRETDLQLLCKSVLNMLPIQYYNPHGADDTTCPLCHERFCGIVEMSEISHSQNCGYLIAKDLSTNLINQIKWQK